MPLKFKIGKRRKRKEGDSASVASGISFQEGNPVVPGYVIVKPDKELNHKLHRAVWNNKDDKVCQIIEERTGTRGKEKHNLLAVDKYDRTALHLAAATGHLRIIDLLLQRDGSAALRMQDKDGNTPIHKAVECDRYPALTKLLLIASDVNTQNNLGYTPLHYAAIQDNVMAANKLLDRGAFTDYHDEQGNTPLSLAAKHGGTKFIDLLIKEDCDVNPVNSEGQTPLIIAAMNDNAEMVGMLLKGRLIKTDIKDVQGKTAMDYAKQGKTGIPDLIEKHEKEQLKSQESPIHKSYNPQGALETKTPNILGSPAVNISVDHLTKDEDTTTNEISRDDSITFDDDTSLDLLTDDVKPTKINIKAAFKERFGDITDGDEMKREKEEEEVKEKKKATIAVTNFKDIHTDEILREDSITFDDDTSLDLLTDDVKPTKINIKAAFKERFGDMLDGDDEMKPDEEEEEDEKKIELKEKEEEEEKKKVGDHSDWDSSKEEEEEEEGEKKGAIKPDSKDLVDLKKKPVGGVLTPLVPISSNIPLEDETKKLLDYSDWDSTDEEEEEEEDDDEEIEIENPVKSGSEVLVKKHPVGSVPTPLIPLVSSVPPKNENKKSLDYSDWDSTDEEEEEEEEEEDDDEEIEIENPVKSGLVKKHPEGSVPTPLVPLVSSVPSKDENKKSLDDSDWDSTDEEEDKEEEEIEIEKVVKLDSEDLVKKHPVGSVPTPLIPLVSYVPPKNENKKVIDYSNWDSSEEEEKEEEEEDEEEEEENTYIKHLEEDRKEKEKSKDYETEDHLKKKSVDSPLVPVTSTVPLSFAIPKTKGPGEIKTQQLTPNTLGPCQSKYTASTFVSPQSSSHLKYDNENEMTELESEMKKQLVTIPEKQTPLRNLPEIPVNTVTSISTVVDSQVLRSLPPLPTGVKETLEDLKKESNSTTRRQNGPVFLSSSLTSSSINSKDLSPTRERNPSVQTTNSENIIPTQQKNLSDQISKHTSNPRQNDSMFLSPTPTSSSSSDNVTPTRWRNLTGQKIELQRRYDDLFESKLQLENSKLDIELESRRLQYQVEQAEEELQSAAEERKKMQEQLVWTETRLSEEVEEKQLLELNRKEMEVHNKSLNATCQQLQEEVDEVKTQLRTERNQRTVTENALSEQQRLYQSLQEEATRAINQQNELSERLETTDSSKTALEEKMAVLQQANTKLEAELKQECSENENIQQQMEGVIEKLKDELSEHGDNEMVTSTILSDMKSKVELLTTALDNESDKRQRFEDQVLSLSTQLSEANAEVSRLQVEEARHEKVNTQHSEQLLREKLSLEKDLTSSQEETRRLAQQLEKKEEKLTATEQELKSAQSVLTEKGNQIVSMQRQIDQQQGQQLMVQENSKRDREQIAHLESQLSSVNERMNNSLLEKQQLIKQVETAERRVSETESVLREEKAKLNSLVESLQENVRKCNIDVRERLDELLSVKEQLTVSEASKHVIEKELHTLQQEMTTQLEINSELKHKLQTVDDAYDLVDQEKARLEDNLNKMVQESLKQEQELRDTQHVVKKYKDALHQTQESLRSTGSERDQVILEKTELESKIVEFEGKINNILSELNVCTEREKIQNEEIQKLNQSRVTLQEMATKLRSEAVSLEHQLEEERSARKTAQEENIELKEIWESEVKAKHKLTEKLMELEQIYRDSGVHVNQEKRKLRKAMEQKGMAEMRLDSLHERNSQLQHENGELTGQLKSLKKKVKEYEKSDISASLRAELDHTQSNLNAEIHTLKKQVENYQDMLKKEGEMRLAADQFANKTKLDLNSVQHSHAQTQSDLQRTQRELRRSEKTVKQLTEEIKTLQIHIETNTLPKSDVDTLQRDLQEKSRELVEKKITEVSDMLEQQSLHQQKVEAMRATQENDRRSKHNMEVADLKHKLNSVLMDMEKSQIEREVAFTETNKYKSLYQQELQRREKVSAKLEKTRERAALSRTRLSMERMQSKKMLDSTYQSLVNVSHSPPSFPTSTPLRHKQPKSSPPDDDLLHSIRSELDRSISRHMDSVSFRGYNKTTRSLEQTLPESHLDSIRRNYRV